QAPVAVSRAPNARGAAGPVTKSPYCRRRARVEERTLRVKVRLAMDMLNNHFHLIQSALGQKVEAKPMGLSHRECSQGRAERCGREVARLPGGTELHLGWNAERATSFLAKFDRSALFDTTGRV